MSAEQPRLFGRMRQRVEDRMVESLYDELARNHTIARPGWDLARVASYAISIAVLLIALALLGLGVFALTTGWPNLFAIIGGLALIGTVVLGRPRFPKLDEDAFILDRDSAPGLFRLIDSVATELDGPRIDTVIIDADFNASVTRIGVRRRPVLTIGLPLWNILTPQERVVVLGHEFGHFVNGDVTQGMVVGSAMNSLGTTYETLYDAAHDDHHLGGYAALRPLVRAFLFLVRIPWSLTLSALALATARSSQRAEYLADLLGARAAGSDAGISQARKSLLVRPAMEYLLAASMRGPLDEIWARQKAEFSALTNKRYAELLKEAEAENLRSDATHPPTHLRIRLLEAADRSSARVVLETGHARAIESELAPAYKKMAKEIRDLARARTLNPGEGGSGSGHLVLLEPPPDG